MIVSFLSLEVKNFSGPLEIPHLSNWTFAKISRVALVYNIIVGICNINYWYTKYKILNLEAGRINILELSLTFSVLN